MRKLVWVGMFVGSSLGGAIPMLWGADLISYAAVVFSVIGGVAGIWVGYRIAQFF